MDPGHLAVEELLTAQTIVAAWRPVTASLPEIEKAISSRLQRSILVSCRADLPRTAY
jgi:hypothetical protein